MEIGGGLTRSPGRDCGERKEGDKLAQRVTWTRGHEEERVSGGPRILSGSSCWLVRMMLLTAGVKVGCREYSILTCYCDHAVAYLT